MKKILILLSFLIAAQSTYAQVTPRTTKTTTTNTKQNSRSVTDKLYIGGMLGGGMSNGGYAFEISPFLGYYLDDYDRLSIGAGPIVQLQGGNNGYQRIRANVFGMRSFARYDILKSMGIFTQVEADYQYYTLSVTEISSGYKYKDGVGVPGLYAGAGLNFGGTYLMGLYSFLWTQKDADRGLAPPIPFILRFGFNFNLGGN